MLRAWRARAVAQRASVVAGRRVGWVRRRKSAPPPTPRDPHSVLSRFWGAAHQLMAVIIMGRGLTSPSLRERRTSHTHLTGDSSMTAGDVITKAVSSTHFRAGRASGAGRGPVTCKRACPVTPSHPLMLAPTPLHRPGDVRAWRAAATASSLLVPRMLPSIGTTTVKKTLSDVPPILATAGRRRAGCPRMG